MTIEFSMIDLRDSASAVVVTSQRARRRVLQAADEIERLRRELAEYRDTVAQLLATSNAETDRADRAEAALSSVGRDAARDAAEMREQIGAWIDDAPPNSAGLDLLRQIITPQFTVGVWPSASAQQCASELVHGPHNWYSGALDTFHDCPGRAEGLTP